VKFLADANVIFPLLLSHHQHRGAALEWFDSVDAGSVVLSRLTRLSVLRLLCTSEVMGPDVLQSKAAIEALEILETDERMVLFHESDGLDGILKQLVVSRTVTTNLWTNAYLEAFARVAGLKLVSFDRGFAKFSSLDFILLGS
jgi:uncharacterized protein